MTTEVLKYALEGSTAVLTMDDGKANALSEVMITSLLDALTRAEKEASAVKEGDTISIVPSIAGGSRLWK